MKTHVKALVVGGGAVGTGIAGILIFKSLAVL